MKDLNLPDELTYETADDLIRFTVNGQSTNWMGIDDSFTRRIDRDGLNPVFLTRHLLKEIEIRNILDEGRAFLESESYPKAIERFDEVLFYDPEYGEALLCKSYALRAQKHYVKALRFYKRAVSISDDLADIEYHKALLRQANDERDGFPKLKLNIYAGDEHFARGDYSSAVESYNRALSNPSKFKDKILSKLLNKKATAYIKSGMFEDALNCFKESLEAGSNDYAIYGEGLCEHELGLEVCDAFKTHLDIAKRQMLRQIRILNDEGFYRESLKISDILWENHFKVDDFYLKLVKARKDTLEGLGMDLSEIEDVIDNIS